MIDSTLFGANLPAGTYTAGDRIELKNIYGPASVRSGRGAARLKMINSGLIRGISGSESRWLIYVKNSDWIDPAINMSGKMTDLTALDIRSGCNNFGHDCDLTPNSSWSVIAECLDTVTTTEDNSIYTLIDVDYPQVASIVDPAALKGIPTGINITRASVPVNAAGTIENSTWTTESVDVFKAGYQYALEKVETYGATSGTAGFIAIANAAGQGGLCRIIPVVSALESIKQTIDYASVLVKGPMDIKTLLFKAGSGGATTVTYTVILDYVKRKL